MFSGTTEKVKQLVMMQEEETFQGPKVSSCLRPRNELSEEAYVLTKQETSLGRGTCVESRRVRETRTPLPRGSQVWVLQ